MEGGRRGGFFLRRVARGGGFVHFFPNGCDHEELVVSGGDLLELGLGFLLIIRILVSTERTRWRWTTVYREYGTCIYI